MCAALLTFVCMLRYSEWNAVPIWSLYSSIFMVVRCADLVSGFFGTYNGTLCQSGSGDSSIFAGIFCTNLTFQDRTPSPLPSPILFFSCRLEASARGRWHRAGLLRRRGDYYLGCGRRRPSSIPRRSPCPDRCHFPLASLYTSASQTPDSIHSRTDATFLWRPSLHPPHRPIPPFSSVTLYLQQNKKSPAPSKYNTARHQRKKNKCQADIHNPLRYLLITE